MCNLWWHNARQTDKQEELGKGTFFMDSLSSIFLFCRWLEMFGLKCPSEKRMREQIAIWNVGDDIACEKAPFLMPKDKKTGKEVMKSRAMAYVIDLQSHIWRSLDLLYE